MDDKITIIEGPPPTFERVRDGWAIGLNETPTITDVAVARLRTFNGPALVERCHRASNSHGHMVLEFRNTLGLPEETPILAARSMLTEDGHLLMLWVRRDHFETETQTDSGDESDDLDHHQE